MKIIDILNKKAEGTLEDRFKFCYKGEAYTYDKKLNRIYKGDNFLNRQLGEQYKLEAHLNDEVFLFQEEVKEIEKREENEEINELVEVTYIEMDEDYNIFAILNGIRDDLKTHENKINELVRVVNKPIKESEEK